VARPRPRPRVGAAGRLPRAPEPAQKPTAQRPGSHHKTRKPLRRLTSRRATAKGKPIHRAGGATRVRRGARRRGTRRRDTGCSPSPTCRCSLNPNWRQHWDVTAWGSHDPRLPLARRDAASPMGRRRRDALRQGRLEGTRTGRTINATGARRREGRPRCSLRVGGVDVAGLAWVAARRRCPRRRSIPCSGPAPLRSRTAPPPRPAPHELVPPPQQRAGGGARRFPASPLLPQLPLSSSPLRRSGTGKGAKPQSGLVAVALWHLPTPPF
jgi:hypothetical protein